MPDRSLPLLDRDLAGRPRDARLRFSAEDEEGSRILG